jgi:hypothetical protein
MSAIPDSDQILQRGEMTICDILPCRIGDLEVLHRHANQPGCLSPGLNDKCTRDWFVKQLRGRRTARSSEALIASNIGLGGSKSTGAWRRRRSRWRRKLAC